MTIETTVILNPNQKTVDRIIEEFLSSERSYCEGLRTLDDTYIQQLTTQTKSREFFLICFLKKILNTFFSEPGTQTGLEEKAQAKLIACLVRVQGLIRLSETLQGQFPEKPEATKLAEWFTQHANFFLLYKEYIEAYENIYGDILACAPNHYYFQQKCAALKSIAQESHAHNASSDQTPIQDITWYTITPVQRIARYGLLFSEMLKHMPNNTTQKASIEAAFARITEIAKKINEKEPKDEPELRNFSLESYNTKANMSPVRFKAAWLEYKQAQTATSHPLSENSKKALLSEILKKHQQSDRNVHTIPEPKADIPAIQIPGSHSLTQKQKQQSNSLKKITQFYNNQPNKRCKQCNSKTLKISSKNTGTYYIQKSKDNTSEFLYQIPAILPSRENTDALSHLISALCEDAANAALAHGTKTVFDFSTSQLPKDLQGKVYRTLVQKLNELPSVHSDTFTIQGVAPELLAELKQELSKPNLGLHKTPRKLK